MLGEVVEEELTGCVGDGEGGGKLLVKGLVFRDCELLVELLLLLLLLPPQVEMTVGMLTKALTCDASVELQTHDNVSVKLYSAVGSVRI